MHNLWAHTPIDFPATIAAIHATILWRRSKQILVFLNRLFELNRT
jgi:hypothetical protein